MARHTGRPTNAARAPVAIACPPKRSTGSREVEHGRCGSGPFLSAKWGRRPGRTILRRRSRRVAQPWPMVSALGVFGELGYKEGLVSEIPPPLSESWVPSDRYYVQLALGQIHGVLHRAVLDANVWLPSPEEAGALTVDDLLAAYLE